MSDALKHRVKQANKVVGIVAANGRRFFYSWEHDRVARFGLDKHEQVKYVDECTGMLMYPFGTDKWPGFVHGAAMQAFIAALAGYIKDGEAITAAWFDENARHWSYADEDMQKVRAEVLETEAVI